MSDLTSLKCPNCGSPLRAEDWNAGQGLIKCGYCHALMNLAGGSEGSRESGPRPEAPMPPGIQIQDTVDGTLITRRWFTPAIIFFVIFCTVWDAFLVFWYGVAFATNGPWIMKVFPLGHVAVGVGLTYFTLACILNTTRILATRGQLRISHGPLPWWGNLDIYVDTLKQLYCKERKSSSRNGVQFAYELWATFRDGTTRRILATSLTEDQALFIEQRIERALGIKDAPVPGELPR